MSLLKEPADNHRFVPNDATITHLNKTKKVDPAYDTDHGLKVNFERLEIGRKQV